MKGCHIEWFIGFDSSGDACIFGHWIKTSTGDIKRLLTEGEIITFVQTGGKIELR